MENKNWKDLYEEYKRAASKPSIFNPKYQGYNKKIENLRSKADALWDDAFRSLENDIVRFDRWKFYFRRIDNTFGAYFNYDDVLINLQKGDIDKAKEAMSRRMVKELGTAVMNFSDSLMEVRVGCMGIDMVLAKVDKSLCDKVRAIMAESKVLCDRAAQMENAKDNRFYAPRYAWDHMIDAYTDQELFVVGATISGYGKVSKVTDSMLIFENGRRVKKTSISYEWEFIHNHPECPKVEAS